MKINSGFSNLAPVAFAAQVDVIVTSLTGNANFPEPWPSTVPSLTQLATDLTGYQSTLNAIATGDRSRVADRDALRQALAGELQILAFYLQSVANGDATKLATTGFPARKDTQRVLSPADLPAPEQVKLQRGVLSGQVIVSCKRVPKAASYEVQTTTADPTVEANWSGAGSYTSCRSIALQGLTPGKVYSVRLRAFGAAGNGAWTTASSLMVV